MNDASWADRDLADRFVDGAYGSVKGYVRTYVLHQHLLHHLPQPPARVLDVGGGAGHQSFPLASAGFDVTIVEPSSAMLDRARERLRMMSDDARTRVTLIQAAGEDAVDAVGDNRFDGVLCHGVLGYLDDPEPVIATLCRCAQPGGLVSIMTSNAHATAVRPAMERRWVDALAAFDERVQDNPLGVQTRSDTPEELTTTLSAHGVATEALYGTWLFVDWLEFAGAALDISDPAEVDAIARVEAEASRRDPYRQMSRAFHLLGRRGDAD
ncbi:class I SAM-dependent methyltransferase [Williamsia deligens]|uniref:Class I SAM-dependent methyltransferase n=1 Tax=Williamsia deligens TaxID=321325 RepID=A0ABW3G8C0_9NOCA|nr:methyltransferase domain-containing protein [Williamsia deligens]MCP2192523.1 Methyltransferase domain-containing protein [Williamsia deligens]